MARFTAPVDTTGIHLSAGHVAVKNGILEVRGDLTAGDRSGLAANGFMPAPDAAPKAEKAPRQRRRKPRSGAAKPAQPKPEKPVSQE